MTNHPNHSTSVENLQRYLRRLSFREPSIPDPPVDGIFESRTEAALREYQRLRGLPVTGKADRETWDRLYSDYRTALSLGSPPQRIALFPLSPDGYMTREGSQGFTVTAIQYMLRELQQHHKELSNIELTGIYDPQTVAAVRLFQRVNQLPEDGLVGLLTWNALADQYNVLFFRSDAE